MKIVIIALIGQKNNIEHFVFKALAQKASGEILILENLETLPNLEATDYLVYNTDDLVLHKMIKDIECKKIDFGFGNYANFKASDVNVNDENITFKLSHNGNLVPIWFKDNFETSIENKIYSVLPAICVGTILGLNIVEISENLKN